MLHQKKKLEVEVLKAVHARIDPKLQVTIHLLVEAPETPESTVLRGKAIPGIQHVVAVASGKGGVGKSTLTANLAVTLAGMGFKVGILDADIYGPSMPLMLDVVADRPGALEVDGVRKMEPVESYGVKVMSIGFFCRGRIKPSCGAVPWRPRPSIKCSKKRIGGNWTSYSSTCLPARGISI